ncbi:hypothetical protein Rleg5DRAFT_6760 [Rhizobium leguminosarum bv. viciae WSM1455]|nr:hypothetical protein Rleg5DRAFT_6760 [Rhizobium leguminosarum bv. viciae WSM1455]
MGRRRRAGNGLKPLTDVTSNKRLAAAFIRAMIAHAQGYINVPIAI